MRRKGPGLRTAIAALALLGLAGCSAKYRNHGYVPSQEDLASVVVGVDTRDSVAETVGAPSTRDLIDDSGYYYVRSRVRHFAYREPEVVERQIVAISFDDAGTVRNIEHYGLEDGKFVPLARRVTELKGGQSTFLQRLFRTLGKLSAGDFLN